LAQIRTIAPKHLDEHNIVERCGVILELIISCIQVILYQLLKMMEM